MIEKELPNILWKRLSESIMVGSGLDQNHKNIEVAQCLNTNANAELVPLIFSTATFHMRGIPDIFRKYGRRLLNNGTQGTESQRAVANTKTAVTPGSVSTVTSLFAIPRAVRASN